MHRAYWRHFAAAGLPERGGSALSTFFALWLGVVLVGAHEITRQATHYAVLAGAPRLHPALLAAAGAGVGMLSSYRARTRARAEHVSWRMLELALLVGALGITPLLAEVPGGLVTLLAVTTAGAGFLLGRISFELFALERTELVAFGVLERWLNPLRLLAFAFGFGLTQLLLAQVGLVRSALGLGACVAALAAWFPRLHSALHPVVPSRLRAPRWAGFAVCALSTGLVVASELWMPSTVVASFDNDVVAHVSTERRHYSITSSQQRLQVFEQGVLRFSSLDAYRYYESFVHPALASAQHRRRVLVLGSGSGLLEREVLRYDEVQELHVVVIDRGLSQLSQALPALSHAGAALQDRRAHVTEAEPLPWLRAREERYDVIFVDLLDPHDYFEGKHFTRYFYSQILAHLSDGGVAALQVTSPFATRDAYDSILATVQAAGLDVRPYAAPVPTLQGWGFALAGLMLPAAPRHPVAPGLAYLDDAELEDLLAISPDIRPLPAPPSMLYDQRAVDRTRQAL